MLRRETPDVVDIISAPDAHEEHVLLAASLGVPVICQKPMAPTLAAAERMVAACRYARVPFFVHENWRWQAPIRALKRVLDERRDRNSRFGAGSTCLSGYPVFANQPFSERRTGSSSRISGSTCSTWRGFSSGRRRA